MIEIGIDPVIVTIGSFELRWYGVMVSLAVLTGVSVPWILAKREGTGGISRNQILSIAVWAVPGGIVGARLIHVLDRWSYFVANPGEIIGGEGMGIFGAILGGTLVGVLYAKVKKFPVGRVADIGSFGLILAQAVGRIGCLINGCCHGTPTDLPWGVVYTHPNTYGPLGIAVHPTHAYELLFDLLIFALLWNIRGRIRPSGALYLIYISLYSIGRFCISFLRVNEPVFLGLQQPQLVSLAVLFIALSLLVYLYRRPVSPQDDASLPTIGSAP